MMYRLPRGSEFIREYGFATMNVPLDNRKSAVNSGLWDRL
jgi:hypothetical protein